MTTQTLYAVRGISGAGKTSFAENFIETLPNSIMLAADDAFTTPNGGYQFESNRLSWAHKDCLDRTTQALVDGYSHVFVCNTFTQEWEMKNYIDLSISFDCRFVSLIIENRHGGINVHDVPESTIDKMKKRFTVKL